MSQPAEKDAGRAMFNTHLRDALIRSAVIEAREAWLRWNTKPSGRLRYKRDGLAQRMFVQGYVAALTASTEELPRPIPPGREDS